MTPEFHPAAEQELVAAVSIGELRAAGLGLELLGEVRRLTYYLCDYPRIGAPLGAGLRRMPLRRFPFAIIYRVSGERLQVLALAHRRMRPRYWTKRR